MVNLYIDIGNSNTKICCESKYYLMTTKEFSESQFQIHFLKKIISKFQIQSIYVASVVKEIDATFLKNCLQIFKFEPHFLNLNSFHQVDFSMKKREPMGADLIALSAFLAKKKTKAIIANVGTATTITYVCQEVFQGTIIAPGLKLSQKSLIEKASGLQLTDLKIFSNKKVGTTTQEALSLGILHGHAAMISKLVEMIDVEAELYLSGNDAPLIKNLLPKFEYVKEATLKGLQIIFGNKHF